VHGENTHHQQRIQAMQDQLTQLDRTYDSRMATANNAQERRLAKETDDQHRLRLNRAIAIAYQLWDCRLKWIAAGCPASRVLECYQQLPPDAPQDWRPPPPSRPVVPQRPTDANIPGEIDPSVPVSCDTYEQVLRDTLAFAQQGTPVPGFDTSGTTYDREKYVGCYHIKRTVSDLLGEAVQYLQQACRPASPGQPRTFDPQWSPTLEVRLICCDKKLSD
jgi:hypothetical protein